MQNPKEKVLLYATLSLTHVSTWQVVLQRIEENLQDVFLIDTETGLTGIEDVHQVGIIDYIGNPVLDVRIDHGCSLSEYYDRIRQDIGENERPSVPENAQRFAYQAIRKTYGPSSQQRCLVSSTLIHLFYSTKFDILTRKLLGVTPWVPFEQLHAAGMTENSIWIEHSTGNFDVSSSSKLFLFSSIAIN